MTTNLIKNNYSTSKKLINLIEEKYIQSTTTKLSIGDFIRINYKISEGDKERIQSYEGLVIAIQNRSLGKSFTIRRNVQGIGLEQIFLFHSPKIESINCKDSSKVRRSKLYYLRSLK
jgi:large subunit ribosomal protein L19